MSQPPSKPDRIRVRRVYPEEGTPLPHGAWLRWSCALLPLLCVVLGGTTTRWSQGIVLMLLGMLLLVAPPRASLGIYLNSVILGLVGLTLLAYLPAKWFAWPSWRAALVDDFETALPATLSAQPWLTAESAVLFLAGICWFYLMATVNWTGDERLRAGRIFAAGVVLLAAAFVVLLKLGIHVSIWPTERHFGPFPNRNQTADFLAAGSLIVLACVHGAWRAGKVAEAGAWMAGWLVVVLAAFTSFSRAGVVLLFLGTAVYVAGQAVRARRREAHRKVSAEGATGIDRWRTGALGLALVALLLSGFMLFGGETLERLRPGSGVLSVQGVTTEFRLRIQADALRLIFASPWCGIGLGNFGAVFPIFRLRSALPARAIHPESDWLWAAAELGVVGLLLVCVGLVLLAFRILPLRTAQDRPLRTAAAIALVACALHAFVDVSMHRIGTVFCALFILGLALRAEGSGSRPWRVPAWWAAPLFRCLGLSLLAIGVAWLVAVRGLVLLPGAQGAAAMEEAGNRAIKIHDYVQIESAMTRALAWEPLGWQWYFRRADARAYIPGETGEAEADFRRARYLEPFVGDLPMDEARIWLSARQPELAVGALLEACRREPERAGEFVTRAYSNAEGDPVFLEQLGRIARQTPAILLGFLDQLAPPQSVEFIAACVKRDPELRGLSLPRRTRFFRYWALRGDTHALAAAMSQRTDWQTLGWRWWAQACAHDERFDEACGIVGRFAAPPKIPPLPTSSKTRAQLEQEAAAAPKDVALALRLSQQQMSDEQFEAALTTIRRITVLPDSPVYFHYLEAVAASGARQWSRSWEAWDDYLHAGGVQE